MTLGSYLWGMTISTVLCLISWMLIIIYINPETAGIAGVFLFFFMLFFFLTGLFALIGFYARKKFSKNTVKFNYAGIAFRQGIFFSLIFIGLLALRKLGMLFWWSAILFVLGIGLLEIYFMKKD
jgi:hypothetical protein